MPKDAPPVEELLEHTGFVRSLARGALGKDDLSEDIVQDAWVSAMQRGPRERKAARSWLYRVVHNRVASLKRRDATRDKYLRQPPARANVPTPSQILEREEARHRMVKALLTLPEIYREPLVLKYYDDRKPREIAKQLDLPVETVRTRLRRGIERLREDLDGDYGDRKTWVLAALPLTWLPKSPPAPVIPPTVLGGMSLKQLAIAVAVVLGVGITAFTVLSGRSPPSTVTEVAQDDAGLAAPKLTGKGSAEPTLLDAIEPSSIADQLCVVTVVDYAGEPVVGADVVLAKRKHDWDYDGLRRTTDAEGRVVVPRMATPDEEEEVPTLAYVLRVARPGEREDLRAVRIDDWRPQDVTVRLPKGYVVSGLVVDAENHPVPGARIELRSGRDFYTVESDALGRFFAAGLPEGRWHTDVSLHWVRQGPRQATWILDSGTRGARLEVPAGARHLVQLPDYDPTRRDHKRELLRVTEFDPTSGKDTSITTHPVSDDGTVWLYGLRTDREYALWWGPDWDDRHLYVPQIQQGLGATRERLAKGVLIQVQVKLPDGFEGWPQIEAFARGIQLRAKWDTIATARTYNETLDTRHKHFTIWGAPDGEYAIRASGRDWNGIEVTGEMTIRAGQPSVFMELERR